MPVACAGNQRALPSVHNVIGETDRGARVRV